SSAEVLPHPTHALFADGKVYVVLNELGGKNFDVAGPGRVAIIDPASDAVTGAIELPALRNCATVDYLPDAKALVVACGGPFSDGPKQVDSAGMAWIDLASTPAQVTVVPSSGFGRPVSGFGLAVLGRSRAFAVVAGEFMGSPKDAIWSFD